MHLPTHETFLCTSMNFVLCAAYRGIHILCCSGASAYESVGDHLLSCRDRGVEKVVCASTTHWFPRTTQQTC